MFNKIANIFGYQLSKKEIDVANPKFDLFDKLDEGDEDVLQHSVIERVFDSPQSKTAHQAINAYKEMVYGAVSTDKPRRLKFYRNMAAFPEVSDAIDEIVDSCHNVDENGEFINLNFPNKSKLSDKQKSTLREEFDIFLSIFDFENHYFEYFRDFIIDGELTWENIVDKDNKEMGIIGINRFPPEYYEFLVDDKNRAVGIVLYAKIEEESGDKEDYSQEFKKYDYFKHLDVRNMYAKRTEQKDMIPMKFEQLTHVDTGIFNPEKTVVYPVLEKARRAYRQLSLIEDAIIIYRLVRAPERLVFNVDTGKLPPSKAEEMVFKMMKRYQSKKVYDPTTGTVQNDYDPHQMMECTTFDTKIPLLDGRVLTLGNIIKEFNGGKKLWAYSCNPKTGEVVPGVISWAGATRKNAKIMKLTFDNGKSVKVTPDHRFPTWNKGEKVQAQDLEIGDSIISFNTQEKRILENTDVGSKYTQIYDHNKQSWNFVHRMVAEYFKDDICEKFIFENHEDKFNVVHHKDYNPKNNSPENLCWMSWNDHKLYHQKMENYRRTPTWAKLVSEKKKYKYSKKLLEDISKIMKDNKLFLLSDVINFINNDPSETFTKEFKKLNSENNNLSCFNKFHDIHIINLIKSQGFKDFREFRKIIHPEGIVPSRSRFYSHSMLLELSKTIDETGLTKSTDLVDYFNKNKNHDFVKEFVKSNKNYKPIKDISRKHITGLVKKYNYKNFRDFKEKMSYHNHKVIKIEYLDEREDTGTLTIDQDHEYHNYHNFALDCGVFTCNSYWFPRPEGSSGTEVSTIGGGSNLGELEDLNYFLRKLYISLKVPFNRYEEPTNTYERISETITYEEYRFAKFVMRIQNQVATGLLDSFKTHLRLRGLWKQYKLKDRDLIGRFIPPTAFELYTEQRLLQIKVENYDTVANHEEFSNELAMKKFLGMSDQEIQENNERLENEAIQIAYREKKISNVEEYGTPEEPPEEE